jgi:PAS domain S-box-containing protein
MATFLENLSGGAALIGRDATVVALNSFLLSAIGPATGKQCYEALAGLSEPCPFCPYHELMQGKTTQPVEARHVRHGRPCSIRLTFLPDVAEEGLILETVTFVTDEPSMPHPIVLPDLLKKLSGLLQISRDLMGHASFKEKMEKVFQDLEPILYCSRGIVPWIEVDGTVYGTPSETGRDMVSCRKIEVEGKLRGYLYACAPEGREPLPEEVYIIEEIAQMIARQVEISDLEDKLRRSEERYKKLASNLAKEIWTRTEALAKETGYLEGILRCSDDMIITTDLESRIVEFNPAAEKMLGWTSEEMQSRDASELWVNPEEREKIVQNVIDSGGITNYETLLRTKSGEVMEISLTLSLLRDEQGRAVGTVGVSKDIGKEKAIMRELERLNRNYRETIHFISHETKNSLIVMSGFLRRLLNADTDPERRKELKIVYHHSQFLEAMSRDFLVMAELEHGEFQMRKQMIENFYEEVILPAMIGLKERYPDSFESYDTSMGGVGAIRLQGDPALLEIVYRNLFGNALKYRCPDGQIAFGVVSRGDHFLFNVWNAGPGVPVDEVEKIFDKFYRVHDENTKTKRGTGLGLFNIRRIIEAHGGRIWCETKPGKWINFLFTLPANGTSRTEHGVIGQ